MTVEELKERINQVLSYCYEDAKYDIQHPNDGNKGRTNCTLKLHTGAIIQTFIQFCEERSWFSEQQMLEIAEKYFKPISEVLKE